MESPPILLFSNELSEPPKMCITFFLIKKKVKILCVSLFADEVGTRIKTFPFPKGAPPLLTELPELLLEELLVLWKLVSPPLPNELDPEFKPFPPSMPAKSQPMIISSSFSVAAPSS